ncbi:hypothetical protein BDY19DRAFT_308413 [Irpex rosettiformis]|uniref:Uncharacterized protein n=1 Tax=Irpex rosettiformis TaxID=378272 RepID=A0ACB8TYX9_9APHY|nr:hypothetical protein BDY19DRAFT_308413 [Irpex rosettiformis]
MGWLQVLRSNTFYTITFLSLVTLALSAHLLSLHLSFTCATMSLVAAIITFVSFPIIIFLDIFQDGTHSPPIVIEITWCIASSVVWLVTSRQRATRYDRLKDFPS